MVVLVLIIPGLVEGMQILGLFILELAGSRIDYSRMFFLGLFILGGRFRIGTSTDPAIIDRRERRVVV
jgi:hypothetical protein